MPTKRVLSIVILMLSQCLYAEEENDYRFFGYFQNLFKHEKVIANQGRTNSFSLQQLNLIAQKDILEDWSAFINFQIVNNFSTEDQWGALSIEEAWLRYRKGNFNLKLGLQIPIFNNFNEIKNKTPLVPYVTRPFVYEDSFSEVVSIEEYIPRNTFVQVYGFHKLKSLKLDYAFYLGNSPNIESWEGEGISGLDTTDTFLFGTRLGVRVKNFKIGVSFSNDQVSGLKPRPITFDDDSLITKLIHRIRLGADISYEFGNFDLKAEFIRVFYDENDPVLELTKTFYYGTLGYYLRDNWFIYTSYWRDWEKFLPAADLSYVVKSLGMSYMINDRITFKVQSARIDFDLNLYTGGKNPFGSGNYYNHGAAVSVFF